MPGFLGRFGGSKESKSSTAVNGTNKSQSRSESPAPSPKPPKIVLPPREPAAPKLVVTGDDDSSSPMTVSPSSVHRTDSMSTHSGEVRNSGASRPDASPHRKAATLGNDENPTPTPSHRTFASSTDAVNQPVNGSRSRANSATSNPDAQLPLSESPTQSLNSRRSGSIGSGDSTPYQSMQPIMDSPTQTRQTLAPEGDKSVTKKKSWRKGSTSETSPPPKPASRTPFKPQARHQSTMGMGLASALAASAMGIAPPPNLIAFSGPNNSLPLPPARRGTNVSNTSSSPPRTGRTRQRGASGSSATAGPRDGQDSGDDSDGYDSEDALSFNDDDIPITGFAVATMKRNQDFHELFPTVPADDYLIDDYGCALQRDILIQGRLYISEGHLSFHANIFGWVTHLIIPFANVTSLEKKMTAYVIPNAIGITEHGQTKHTFASFLARDTAFDVIHNVWKHAGPARSSAASPISERGPLTGRDSVSGMGGIGARKPTQCACSKANAHYANVAMEAIVPGTPEQIYNLMFASGFIKDFMAHDQKLMDIQVSDWQPSQDNAHLLSRNMSYIKPLGGGFGPKQTKCELRDENQHVDYDDYVSSITTTRTPDVPSGGVFAVKTRTCLMWAGTSTTRITITYTIEWTGKSFIKGIIEKSAGDGQKSYYVDLEAAMRKYIAEHRTEFLPEGVDAAAADHELEVEEAALSPTTPSGIAQKGLGDKSGPSSRGLQWALDTFEGTAKVARDSFSGAIDIITDGLGGASRTTLLTLTIGALILSNVYTIFSVGGKTKIPTSPQPPNVGDFDRERWVGDAVRAFMEVQQSMQSPAKVTTVVLPVETLRPHSPPLDIGQTHADLKEELAELRRIAAVLEERVTALRSQLDELD